MSVLGQLDGTRTGGLRFNRRNAFIDILVRLFLKHDGGTYSLNHQQNFVEQLEPITGTVSNTHT